MFACGQCIQALLEPNAHNCCYIQIEYLIGMQGNAALLVTCSWHCHAPTVVCNLCDNVYHRCGLSHNLEDEDVVQIVKKKVDTAADGRGRFKTKSDAPLRISDREKKAALKT